MSQGFWLARWMLVLLLVADLIGAPLHHHHHDSGVDGTMPSLSAADLQSHVEDTDHDTHLGHATLALRPAGSVVQPVAADAAPLLLAFLPALFAELVQPDDGRLTFPPNGRSPPIRSHRSLPPAGRAPPQLA